MAPIPTLLADEEFKQRRIQNWLLLGFFYICFYLTRYNFSATNSELSQMFGWANSGLGVFETVLPAVYGLSVMVNGPLTDRIGGKKAFLIGGAGVVLANLCFGLLVHLLVQTPAVWVDHVLTTPAVLNYHLTQTAAVVLLATVWGVNGYFQSFGALSIVKVNAQWFHISERGTFSGIFGVMIRFGLFLAFSGIPMILAFAPLPWAYWLPAILTAVVLVLNYRYMEKSPADTRFGPLDTGDGEDEDEEPAKLMDVLRKIFSSRAAWIVAGSSVMIGFVRRGTIDTWYGKFFTDVFMPEGMVKGHYIPYQVAAWAIPILGILGGFALGMLSDGNKKPVKNARLQRLLDVFRCHRPRVASIGFIGMALGLVALGASMHFAMGPVVAALLLGCVSFFVNGAHGLIGGAVAMDFGGKKASATAAGFFDGMQYLVTAPFTGYLLALIIDKNGWGLWPWLPVPFALIGAALMGSLWKSPPTGKKAAH